MATRNEPPENYKLSRAAMREKYGSRSIDARAKQSPLDSTPSGREARARQAGASDAEAVKLAEDQFRAPFANRQQVQPEQPSIFMPPAPVSRPGMQSGGLATPEDVGMLRGMGAIGTVKTPYGTVTLPQTIPAQDFSEFLPTTSGPLNMFELPKPKPYMGGVLTAASRWSRQI